MISRYIVMYPTVNLNFLVATNMQAHGAVMVPKDVVTVDQHQYRLFTMAAGHQRRGAYAARWRGCAGSRTGNAASTPQSANTPNIWLLVGLLALFAVLSIGWVIYVMRRQQRSLNAPSAQSVASQQAKLGRAKADSKSKSEVGGSKRRSVLKNAGAVITGAAQT